MRGARKMLNVRQSARSTTLSSSHSRGGMQFTSASPKKRNSERLTAEEEKARSWRVANPETPITTYNQLLATTPGPLQELRAFPRRIIDEKGNAIDDPSAVQLLWNPKAEWSFTGNDLKNVKIGRAHV